jgi:hypothetical protein
VIPGESAEISARTKDFWQGHIDSTSGNGSAIALGRLAVDIRLNTGDHEPTDQISPCYIPPDPYPAAGFITDRRIRRKFQSPLRLTRPPYRKVSSSPSVLINPSDCCAVLLAPPLFILHPSRFPPQFHHQSHHSPSSGIHLWPLARMARRVSTHSSSETHTLPSLQERFIRSTAAGWLT